MKSGEECEFPASDVFICKEKKPKNRRMLGTPAFSANRIRPRPRARRCVREVTNRASSAVGGADLEQAKQSDLATMAILGDGDFLRVVQNILDDLGGWRVSGLAREGLR